jgi:hypothetical protein
MGPRVDTTPPWVPPRLHAMPSTVLQGRGPTNSGGARQQLVLVAALWGVNWASHSPALPRYLFRAR